MRTIAAGTFATALLLSLSAFAQNKCVDANGKVTYQQDPCPGTARASPLQSPALPATSGIASREARLHAEIAELDACASDWEREAPAVGRMQASTRQDWTTRFLAVCSKHGFQAPDNRVEIQRNHAVAKEARRKIGLLRDALNYSPSSGRRAHEIPPGAPRPPEPGTEAARREACAYLRKELAEGRARIPLLPQEQRAPSENSAAKMEKEIREICR